MTSTSIDIAGQRVRTNTWITLTRDYGSPQKGTDEYNHKVAAYRQILMSSGIISNLPTYTLPQHKSLRHDSESDKYPYVEVTPPQVLPIDPYVCTRCKQRDRQPVAKHYPTIEHHMQDRFISYSEDSNSERDSSTTSVIHARRIDQRNKEQIRSCRSEKARRVLDAYESTESDESDDFENKPVIVTTKKASTKVESKYAVKKVDKPKTKKKTTVKKTARKQ